MQHLPLLPSGGSGMRNSGISKHGSCLPGCSSSRSSSSSLLLSIVHRAELEEVLGWVHVLVSASKLSREIEVSSSTVSLFSSTALFISVLFLFPSSSVISPRDGGLSSASFLHPSTISPASSGVICVSLWFFSRNLWTCETKSRCLMLLSISVTDYTLKAGLHADVVEEPFKWNTV